ncbi:MULTISPECIES: DUF305 domain-containing protein [unclassified Leucobacter]|uniref:DUF305 domain-containing protein n=1 Tax=unclassified Leucobacter TaxID=2621730 RepID=UPI000622A7C5|nr:DUF305 domain-containing protein [Leucobacter sp. Ag1]KKI22260.1 hypothetical protein XM48_02400 [Leucobacter sp. Ag1]
MNTRALTLLVAGAAIAGSLAVGGCAAQSAGEPSPKPSATATRPADVNDADTMFVSMMIGHHQQAIEMSEIVLAKSGLDPRVRELAKRIKAAQAPEITRLQGWLSDWGMAGADSSMGGHSMGGMLSTEQLDRLKAADGATASRLFLEQMIEHHEGAVEMAKPEVADGANAEVKRLAQSVIDDQSSEIAQMRELLASLQ